MSAIPAFTRRTLALMAEWRARKQMRDDLARMNARGLADIGWMRTSANIEINKPFWRA
jgi:uncharacterized protein YjiS (DUF1127 family)